MFISKFKFKYRLLKRWRKWRVFKNLFLKQKKKIQFQKLRSFIFVQKIIKKQYAWLYGKAINRTVFKNSQSKFVIDSFFFNTLSILEQRLGILVVRMFYVSFLEIDTMLKSYCIIMNGKEFKSKKILVPSSSYISIIDIFSLKKKLTLVNWFKVNCWYWFNWLRFYKTISIWHQNGVGCLICTNSSYIRKKVHQRSYYKLSIKLFWSLKSFLSINYIEVSVKYLIGILLRKPVLGEVILNNKIKSTHSYVLSKVYLTY